MNRFGRPACSPLVPLAAWALAAGACRGPSGPADGARARAHAEAIVACGPRPAGSAALRQVGDYLVAEVKKLGLEAHEQTWEETVTVYGQPRTLALRNVWTEIKGQDPEHGPILLLAAHYDSKLCEGHPKPEHNFRFVAALDSAASCGLLLELARVLKDRRNVPNVWIAWFDGEESQEWEWDEALKKCLLGSQYFAKTMAADKARFPKDLQARLKAMVLLDLLGDRNLKIDRDTRSNPDLLDIFGRAAAEIGFGAMYTYESPMTDDHVPFRDRGVSVIDLIDFRWRYDAKGTAPGDRAPPPAEGTYAQWWHTADDTMDHVSADSLATVGALIWHALPLLEKEVYGGA